jgi:hypothetical protein
MNWTGRRTPAVQPVLSPTPPVDSGVVPTERGYGEMILALDETGDFRIDSHAPHFFVAVQIRAGKEAQFAAWESAIPRRHKGAVGEFKGATLPEDYLAGFVRDVLEAEPVIRITPVGLVPAMHKPGTVEQHKNYSLATVNDSQIQISRAGNAKLAKQVAEMASWLRRMSLPLYLKASAMFSCIAYALRDTVGHAIAGGYDLELPPLEFKIDRDFVRDRTQQVYWGQFLRTHMKTVMVGENALVSLDAWEKTGHPFRDLYARTLPNGRRVWDLTALFRDRCRFLDSKRHFELRVADLVAAILRRYHSRRDCRAIYPNVVELFCGTTGPIHQLVLDPSPSALRRNQEPLEEQA